ncbi:10394_t:CDS:2 [Paraglomus occultum]|uniref:10394_t:CDS:1 n=1 Tax=Paraglomus occultum TaxID=144539 RepID=A0A9N9EYF2_9GLOM|nr:10394_t:CDS:2 [Paraglomus occultum]
MCSDSSNSDSTVSISDLDSTSLNFMSVARASSLPHSSKRYSFTKQHPIALPDSRPDSSFNQHSFQNQTVPVDNLINYQNDAPTLVHPSNSTATENVPVMPRPSRPSLATSVPDKHQTYRLSQAISSQINVNSDADYAHYSVRISSPRPMGQFGQCEQCTSARTGYNWCQYCDTERLQNDFVNWTSGCKEIDDFIQVAQLKAINVRSIVEWIDYKEFRNVSHLANGGNSSVFTAYWPRGPIRAWDFNIGDWERGWSQRNPDLIILKRLNNSNNVTTDFLKELAAYHQFSTMVTHVVRCYGISHCPITNEYIVVTSYAEDGDLRQYISKNFDNFTLQHKIITLRDIAVGLVTIHRAGLLHKDLHTGNILRSGSWTMISDLGLCWNNASVAGTEETVRGVLPYVAPEVLRGMAYTRAADVYSVGMIMYELWSGRPPFETRDYDASLALEICSGKRPEIDTEDIPDYYSIIMQACWDRDPNMRPTSRELERIFDIWVDNMAHKKLPCLKTFRRRSMNLTVPSPMHHSSERTKSLPIPQLSAEQHEYLKRMDKHREELYDRCLDRRLIEMAEKFSEKQEHVNPITWTRELKTLADGIFGDSVNLRDARIVTVPEPITTVGNNEIENNNINTPSVTPATSPSVTPVISPAVSESINTESSNEREPSNSK